MLGHVQRGGNPSAYDRILVRFLSLALIADVKNEASFAYAKLLYVLRLHDLASYFKCVLCLI